MYLGGRGGVTRAVQGVRSVLHLRVQRRARVRAHHL